MIKRNELYTKGFAWGKKEHRLEKWTNNALAVTLIIFAIAFYVRSWYFMHFAFMWLVLSFIIHLAARFCHRREKKWHTQAHATKKSFWTR